MTKNAGKSGKVLEAYKWCILQVLNEKELFVFYLILKSLTKMRKIYALMVLLFAVLQLPAQVLVQGRPHPTAKPQMVSPRAIADGLAKELTALRSSYNGMPRVKPRRWFGDSVGTVKLPAKRWRVQSLLPTLVFSL